MAKRSFRTPPATCITPTNPNAAYLSSWENVKRALKAAAQGCKGSGTVSIVVAFNGKGIPVKHTRPKVTQLEPKDDGWLEALGE